MNKDWEDVYFLSHVNIKNIIGKELINSDNVAVAELVKNSYDAGASKVIVEFKNLTQSLSNQEILIVDDGKGMDRDDILHKWLNLAYSIKRVYKAQNQRLQSGNKGIGRFSCDRLGEYLDIYTKKDKIIYHLKIEWNNFEDKDHYNIQINDIPMKLRQVTNEEVKEETSYNIKSSGTILKIRSLRNKWIEIYEDKLFDKIKSYNKLISLKSTLEKLINKSQVETNNFNIYLKVNDIQDQDETSYMKKINGKIENKLFKKLDFNTTYIHSMITEDGRHIITKLKDRDKIIFEIVEKNVEFPELKNIKIILMYLNPYGKAYFEKQMGLKSVEYGSVYLFVNGFRIPPYGDITNDSFGMEVRKNQGRSRYLSNREIIGRIEIKDIENNFEIISSREGIVDNKYFQQLIHKSTKSTKAQNKNNGFFYKVLKRLEKYVVNGLKWDSVPKEYTEAKIKQLVSQENWNESKEVYKISYKEKLQNISKDIFKILTLDKNSLESIYISQNIIHSLVEENDELNTQKNIATFIKKFSEYSSDAIIDTKTKKEIRKVIKLLQDEKLKFKVDFVLNKKIDLEKIADIELKSKEVYKKIEVLEKENAELKNQKEKLIKQNIFQKSLIGQEKEQLISLQHQINHSSSRIDRHIKLLIKKLDNTVLKLIEKNMKVISFENEKISSISSFITRANFNLTATEIKEDIIKFIKEYIYNIYSSKEAVIDTQDLDITFINKNNISLFMQFRPLEITMMIDNFISNSIKAKSTILKFEVFKNEKNIEIWIIDNGKGVDESVKETLFELAETTTDGSGIGLYHIKNIVSNIKGKIFLDKNKKNGAKFIIRILNET